MQGVRHTLKEKTYFLFFFLLKRWTVLSSLKGHELISGMSKKLLYSRTPSAQGVVRYHEGVLVPGERQHPEPKVAVFYTETYLRKFLVTSTMKKFNQSFDNTAWIIVYLPVSYLFYVFRVGLGNVSILVVRDYDPFSFRSELK
jgi:hypothetical protein